MSPDSPPPTTQKRTSFFVAASVLVGLILVVTAAASLLVLFYLPSLSVLSLLAYSFGCRHGIDADHIAAIDNVTRRLVETSGRSTMTVGIWFSLGHCTVVVLLCAAVLAGASTSSSQFEELTAIGEAIGPWVTAAVLLTIGSINLCNARELHTQWKDRKMRGHAHELASLVTKCCPSFFDAVDRPSRVFWIGLLFGLDTATEIALLTTTAIALPDVPYLSALVLPLLFAAGMALIDSLNAVLMLWAQEWRPTRAQCTVYTNLFLTLAAAALAPALVSSRRLDNWRRYRGWSISPAVRTLLAGFALASDHLELLGVGAVAAFLFGIMLAVAFAHRCVPSREACEQEQQSKLRESLLRYVRGGEYIVRFE